jgi:adenine-specific DNA methylase
MNILNSQVNRAIENSFPIEMISQLAKRESWRKEVYRPPYYIHKWWARRLGSIFRAIVLSCCLEKGQKVDHLFYKPVKFPEFTIFDPFMGSGTTIGEAAKLGCRAIGRDINPVSVGMVTTALQTYSRQEVIDTFTTLRDTISERLLSFYKIDLMTGETADVLYYFWVKVINCPLCGHEVELFKSRIFAKHARPRKHPEAKAICPECSKINEVKYDDELTYCSNCGTSYNPQSGTVKRATTTCPACQAEFKTITAVRKMHEPPRHKMYAKMILTDTNEKVYLPIDEGDQASYRRAESLLSELWSLIPQEKIKPGYNTNQVLSYNYTHWYQMFNARQLVTATLLASEIAKIQNPHIKMLFAYLLSGTLEFNNMFCSFKGEGTGAVRHMFSHHILKPELMPLEANLWGTPRSSGAFSTLFQSRVLKLLDYKRSPFELKLVRKNGKLKSKKIFRVSQPVNKEITNTYKDFSNNRESIYLSCGDSASTDIPNHSVDFVITDPPFFDNVHYSQLADFFYVWLRQILPSEDNFQKLTTRSSKEVQDTDSENFTSKLTSVLKESYRVLKDEGLLVFTYHHSRVEGWVSVYQAVREAGFYVTNAHPVKAEMSVSIPIQQATSPVHFDLILVCRKANSSYPELKAKELPMLACANETKVIISKLIQAGMEIGVGDAKVILMGKILTRLPATNDLSEEIAKIYSIEKQVDSMAENLLEDAKLQVKRTDQGFTTPNSIESHSELQSIARQARLPW